MHLFQNLCLMMVDSLNLLILHFHFECEWFECEWNLLIKDTMTSTVHAFLSLDISYSVFIGLYVFIIECE